MLILCFENEGGHKRFKVTKESTDAADLGTVANPIKLPVTHYLQSLDTAFFLHVGIGAVNFYLTKDDYDNDIVAYTLDLMAYDAYTTVREHMIADSVAVANDPIVSMYMAFAMNAPLIVDEPFFVEMATDHKVADNVGALAKDVGDQLTLIQNLVNSNTNNSTTIAAELQSALSKLEGADSGLSPLSENHVWQQ